MSNPIFSSTAELSVEQRGPVPWLTRTGTGSKAFCAGADLQSAQVFTTDDLAPHGHLAQLLDQSPAAIRRGVSTFKKVESMAFEEFMSFTESQMALFTLTEDAKEGQKALQEKRKPNWIGR